MSTTREAVEFPGRTASSGRVRGLERWLVRRLWRAAGEPKIGVVLWNGERLGADAPLRLHIRSRRAFYRLLRNPRLAFGDLYSEGALEVEGSLPRFLEALFRAMDGRPGLRRFGRLPWVAPRPRRNTLSGSRENIHHHYDIGNAFYALWLDSRMQYTCAYYPDPAMSLEQAQLAKIEHVCRKLRLRRGQTVVEAGCGWGGLALHMARRYGVKVRAFNISREQVAYARERARAEGMEDRVEYVEDDYRNITGRYDVFVSVGMLEHVGRDHYRELGAVIDRVLARDGRGLIHSIGRNRPRPMDPWIEKRIFPGAYPPSLREMMEIFEPFEFSVLDVENLRLHYAKTLQHWLARFDAQADRVREMFDARFERLWRLYLAGSIAAFSTGALQLFQIVFARPNVNALPWSRAYLYE